MSVLTLFVSKRESIDPDIVIKLDQPVTWMHAL